RAGRFSSHSRGSRNRTTWQIYSRSLRLRIAMRTSNTEFASQAAQQFSAACESANRFMSNDDLADLDWTGTQPSQKPIFENVVLDGRVGDTRLSRSMIDVLTERDDPRLAVYAVPAASDDEYRGLPNGNRPAIWVIPKAITRQSGPRSSHRTRRRCSCRTPSSYSWGPRRRREAGSRAILRSSATRASKRPCYSTASRRPRSMIISPRPHATRSTRF
ncbi:MAG: SusD/RagB family nutrient-binding outer membrane lipoprotein, partial [Gemmatimonas sp.]|nr:SusD/RagB family nutrient-binding outer membrane lipoprotein [Gemmatimonas sp.]